MTRNEFPVIDIQKAEREAQRLRAEAFAKGFKRLIAWVKHPRGATVRGGHQSA